MSGNDRLDVPAPSTEPRAAPKEQRKYTALLMAMVALLASLTTTLKLQGRIWWCKCGGPQLWISDPLSSHTSQHLFDPYSFTHISHGFFFFWFFYWVSPRLTIRWKFFWAMAVEAAWEVFENTSFVINRYRETTAAIGYEGDSIGNSLGDMASCGLGFALAYWLGWKKTLALFIVFELALLVTIRDSLLLNIFMLAFPIDALIKWQGN